MAKQSKFPLDMALEDGADRLTRKVGNQLSKIFSGRQPRQSVKISQRFRDWLCPHVENDQGADEKMVTHGDTLENLNILTRLSGR